MSLIGDLLFSTVIKPMVVNVAKNLNAKYQMPPGWEADFENGCYAEAELLLKMEAAPPPTG